MIWDMLMCCAGMFFIARSVFYLVYAKQIAAATNRNEVLVLENAVVFAALGLAILFVFVKHKTGEHSTPVPTVEVEEVKDD